MLEKQKKEGKMISPSELIYELGKTVDDENSIIYWATKNNIPILLANFYVVHINHNHQ